MDATEEQPSFPDEDIFIPLPVHKAQANKAILLLLFFSFLMVSLPFLVFFATKNILQDYNITGFNNVVWSVSAAVLTVNLIIAGYVYIAFKEQEYDSEGRPIIEDKIKSD
ncbi:hypothetical protein WA026_021383 [Henosepilachna vigintioctopunctata]|uniref:Vacuolar ATPase assembly integral membrane protein VMA21 homolog n=1 Tax=Henosepilachna vigintioctopunctata TaxID=420089 RepID=A0AAW1TX26_9CUCU